MTDNQGCAHRWSLLSLLLSAGIIAFIPATGLGQDTPQLLELRTEPSKEPLAINLRPNVSTSVSLSLQNPGTEDLRGVVVKLVHVAEDRVIGQTTEIDKLPAKGKVRVAFPKAKEAKEAKNGKDGAEKKDKDGGGQAALPGPPFKVQLWIEAKQPNDFVTIKRDVLLVIKEPRDYLVSLAYFDKAKRRVAFKVKFGDADSVTGPQECAVQLVLGPEFQESKKGTYSQLITGPRQAVDLFADDIAFTAPTIREGRACLTVDGYERAFTYPLTLTGSGNPDELPLGRKVGARIRVPRFAKPAEKFKVFLEMDGPLDADYRVEVALDRAGTKEYETVKFIGLRQQKVGLTFSPAGDFVCHTKVQDWQAEFNTTGVFGNAWFRVSVFKKGDLVALLVPEETRPHLADQEYLAESKRLFALVTQDETPPQEVAFVNLPKEWLTGKPLPVLVRVKVPEAHQAPIDKKVIFFRGKAAPDGKINPENILGIGEFDAQKGTCSIVLPGPESPETLVLSVQLMTRAGIVGTKTGTVNVKDAKFALCKIKGVVAHGKDGQPNLAVTLADGDGKAKASVKTNAKGEFVFDKVPPGKYLISSVKAFPALVGSAKVVVPEGVELIDNVSVRLMAK